MMIFERNELMSELAQLRNLFVAHSRENKNLE